MPGGTTGGSVESVTSSPPSTVMPGGTAGVGGVSGDTGRDASALSLSELEESESESHPDDEEDEKEAVSESESPLSSESALGPSSGSAGAIDTLGATVMPVGTAGVF